MTLTCSNGGEHLEIFWKKEEQNDSNNDQFNALRSEVHELVRPSIKDEADIEVRIWEEYGGSFQDRREAELRIPDPFIPEKYRETAATRVWIAHLSASEIATRMVRGIAETAPWLLDGEAFIEWAERTATRKRFDHYAKKYGENGEAR